MCWRRGAGVGGVARAVGFEAAEAGGGGTGVDAGEGARGDELVVGWMARALMLPTTARGVEAV